MSIRQWMKHMEAKHAKRVKLLEQKYGYRFFNVYDVARPMQTVFCVMMMNGGGESDNETFLETGQSLEEAFANVDTSIAAFLEEREKLQPVPSVSEAISKI